MIAFPAHICMDMVMCLFDTNMFFIELDIIVLFRIVTVYIMHYLLFIFSHFSCTLRESEMKKIIPKEDDTSFIENTVSSCTISFDLHDPAAFLFIFFGK